MARHEPGPERRSLERLLLAEIPLKIPPFRVGEFRSCTAPQGCSRVHGL